MVVCEVAPAPPHPLAPAVRYRRDQGIIKRHARHRTTTATGIADRKGCLHFSHITRCINVIDLKSLRRFASFLYSFEAITEDSVYLSYLLLDFIVDVQSARHVEPQFEYCVPVSELAS